MYGLILEGICQAIKAKYGEDTWREIKQHSGIHHSTFNIHKSYSETLIPRITKAAHEITGCTQTELMDIFGNSFVSFVGQFGYDRILKVLGRNLRDFLNGLDNLHEYLRFSYPKLKPPSFFCEHETKDGLTLHYRSKRKGFVYYVCGQIKAVGRVFYDTPVEIEIVSMEDSIDTSHVVMQLSFNNTAYVENEVKISIFSLNFCHNLKVQFQYNSGSCILLQLAYIAPIKMFLQ